MNRKILNLPYKACKASERGPFISGTSMVTPKFHSIFPRSNSLSIIIWLEYSEIGIIFGISSEVNTKLLIQIYMGDNI